MKKLFLLAAAMLTFASCSDEEVVKQEEEPKVDEVSVLPKSKDFENTGGDVSVMVTSTGEWTVATKENATYDWITADKTKGADGEMVKFTVDANETEDTRFAYYVFTCGTATTEFKIAQVGAEAQLPLDKTITIEEKEVTRDFNQGRWEVLVKYTNDVDYRGLKFEIPADATWFKHGMTLEGDEEGTAKMVFEYEAWDGFEPREVDFTISYDEESIPMKMIQKPEAKIIPEMTSYALEPAGGTLQVKVQASVEYNVEVITEDGSDSWLTDHALADGVHSWNYSAFETNRSATIKFTEAAPAEGAEPIVAEVNVVQSNALITTVANMANHRAVFAQDAANKDVFKLGKDLTVELYIKPDKYSLSSVSAMFGIERRFLIRHSDVGKPGEWEIILAETRENNQGEKEEIKVNGGRLVEGQWTHIAVVLNSTEERIYAYQDGEQVGDAQFNSWMQEIDLTETYTANGMKQEFALGYAYDVSRYFKGQMAEVRVWNRPLSYEEINAENHFYRVDPNSEGLVAYWKMNDGKGSTIKDHTANGNNLVSQEYLGGWNDADLVWEPVSLPE